MGVRVLVPLDGSELAAKVIYRIAAEYGSEAEVVLGHVRTPDVPARERTATTSALITQVSVARTRGVSCRLVTVEADTVPKGIAELAASEEADIIAMFTDPARTDEDRPEGPFSESVSEMAALEVRTYREEDVGAVA